MIMAHAKPTLLPITEARREAAKQSLRDLMQRMVAAQERMDNDPDFRERVLRRVF